MDYSPWGHKSWTLLSDFTSLHSSSSDFLLLLISDHQYPCTRDQARSIMSNEHQMCVDWSKYYYHHLIAWNCGSMLQSPRPPLPTQKNSFTKVHYWPCESFFNLFFKEDFMIPSQVFLSLNSSHPVCLSAIVVPSSSETSQSHLPFLCVRLHVYSPHWRSTNLSPILVIYTRKCICHANMGNWVDASYFSRILLL